MAQVQQQHGMPAGVPQQQQPVPGAANPGVPGAAPATQNYASLYVGDLSPDVTEANLYDHFNAIGPVASIRVCRDSVNRRSLGYAYVNYHVVADAERASDTLNYSMIKDRSCRIMWSHRDPALRKSGSGNVFVRNLDRKIDNKSLYDTFSLFGNILSCKVASDDQGKSLGYGFVHYETDESAQQAIERVNNMQIGDKTVFVGPFIKKEQRAATTEKKFTNVYFKNLGALSDKEVQDKLEAHGTVTSFVVQTDSKGRRFGFANFAEFDMAKAAVAALHGLDFRAEEDKTETPESEEDDGKFYCQRAMSKAERAALLKNQFNKVAAPAHTGVNLYIKNLDDSIDDEKLKELFAPFGQITSAKVMCDDKEVSRGFGFVSFSTPEEATKAVTEMHLKLVHQKPLYVGLAEKREQRQARLSERYRPRPGMPQMAGGFQQQPMYFSPGMGGVRPNMQMGQMMNGGQWNAGGARPQGSMRPSMPQPYMQMPYVQARGGMMGANMARPKMMGPQAGVAPQRNAMYKFTPQARNQQAPNQMVSGSMEDVTSKAQGGVQFDPNAPLTAAGLAAAPPGMQKQMLGEKLFPLISRHQPELAGKITGMMLEMDNSELLMLLESETQMKNKVDEALRVIESASNNANKF